MFDRITTWINRPKVTTPEISQTEESFLKGYRRWAFRILAVLIVAVTCVGLAESYNGLYIWFSTHYVTGIWADVAPIAIDAFSVIGEVAIFAALTGHWHWKKRIIPWAAVALGFLGSLGGNIGRVAQHHMITVDLTAMTFPIAGAFGILIGFSVLKSLAKEVADRSYQASLITVKAEVIDSEATPTVELFPTPTVESVASAETPALKGLDVLIPPRGVQLPPATVPVSEDGANTVTEWRGLPDNAHKLRRPDLQTAIRNTGQFEAVK